MPPSKEQLERTRHRRRGEIKRAALEVFARHGIDGAKMSMVAEEAGVSQGLFYRYFASKDELYAELVEELFDQADHTLAALDQGEPLEQLRRLTVRMLDPKWRPAFLLIQRARLHADPPLRVRRALAKSTPEALVAQVVPLFRRGQRGGAFIAGNAQQLLTWYFGVIDAVTFGDRPPPPADMLLRMLRPVK